MAVRPALTVLHQLPGRMRLHTSLPARDPDRLERAILGHEGVEQVRYTQVTQTLLVLYAPEVIEGEEIVVRAGLALARDYDATPVRILAQPDKREVSEIAVYAGLILGVAAALRLLGQDARTNQWLERLAGLTTFGAIAEHAVSEVREKGNFDPEALSGIYLLMSLLRGNFLPAALFTWATTFGRHLVRVPARALELRPVRVGGEDDAPHYEVVISAVPPEGAGAQLLGLMPAAMASLMGGAPPSGDMLEDIRRVAKTHDEVLEGLGEYRHGIPVRIR